MRRAPEVELRVVDAWDRPVNRYRLRLDANFTHGDAPLEWYGRTPDERGEASGWETIEAPESGVIETRREFSTGNYVILAQAPGYEYGWQRIDIADEAPETIPFAIRLRPSAMSLTHAWCETSPGHSSTRAPGYLCAPRRSR